MFYCVLSEGTPFYVLDLMVKRENPSYLMVNVVKVVIFCVPLPTR